MLEQHVGARTVAQFFDDDQDGSADTALVNALMARATATAAGILYDTFPSARIESVQEDERYIDLVCTICVGMAARRNPAWQREDGSFPWSKEMKEAKATLKEIAKGLDRFAAEQSASENLQIAGATSPTLPVTPTFAPSRERPTGPGGF